MRASIVNSLYPYRLLLVLAALIVPANVRAQLVIEDAFERFLPSQRADKQEHSPELSEVERLIVKQTNSFREEEGLKRLTVNPALSKTAQYFANYMAETDQYGHTADGKQASQRAQEHGYEYCMVAENIAYQYSSVGFATEELADKFVQGWKQSPGHRENMLRSSATETGVAIAQSDESGNYYAVQMFGRPRSMRIEFQVANRSDTAVEYEIGQNRYTLPPRYTRTHQRCQAEQIVFTKGEQASVRPKGGDRFVLTGKGTDVAIQREQTDSK